MFQNHEPFLGSESSFKPGKLKIQRRSVEDTLALDLEERIREGKKSVGSLVPKILHPWHYEFKVWDIQNMGQNILNAVHARPNLFVNQIR